MNMLEIAVIQVMDHGPDERVSGMGNVRDLLVALDCSTTASKAVVFDASGHTVAVGRSPIRLHQPGPGMHEQDPDSWWSATCAAIGQAMAQVATERIAALCITTQRETFVCVDDQDRPIYPGILWMDTRARDLVAELGSTRVHELSGRPPDNTPSLYKIAWLLRHRPEAMARARHLADVSAYLHHRLVGRWVASSASADCIGLFDMTRMAWSDELVAHIGLDATLLPEVVAPGEQIGLLDASAAQLTGLPVGTPVIAGAGDGQCAALGAGVHAFGGLYLNMGTAIVCGRSALEYSWDTAYRTVGSADGRGYLLEAFTAAGTYLVNWFRDNLDASEPTADSSPEEELQRAAAQLPPGSEGLLALPYWNAAQTPYWDSRARGALVGLTGRHGRPHIYRALLEGIGFEVKLEVDGLNTAGDQPQHVYVTGGGSRSPLWMQVIADILERPLTLCGEQETTALGAAMIGAVSTGLHPGMGAAANAMIRYGTTVIPDEACSARYRQLWPVYQSLYPSLRGAMNVLSDLT